jgi:hypothetical protein
MRKDEVTERMKSLMSAQDQEAPGFHPPGSMHNNNPKQEDDTRSPEQIKADKKAAKRQRDLEKKEHVQLENWLNQREWFYDHQRMDKAATNQKGIPDFVIGVYGLLVCVEFKRPGKKLTPEQEEWRRRASVSRCRYHVYDNAGEAITMLLSLERSLCHNAE